MKPVVILPDGRGWSISTKTAIWTPSRAAQVWMTIGAFGTPHLDPAVLVVAAGGLLDSGEQEEFGSVLPKDLSLKCQEFFNQALVGFPGSLRLTNCERLAVLDF